MPDLWVEVIAAMHFTETRVASAWIIDPSPHYDERGRFMRTWCLREFEQHGIHFIPVQANIQFSPRKGTVRGNTRPLAQFRPRPHSEFAFRVEERSRSGRIADTTRRTGRDPASFRPLDGTVTHMNMRRKAQEMCLP